MLKQVQKAQAPKQRTLSGTLKMLTIAALAVAIVAFILLWLPLLISKDPCLRDWDVVCTYAPSYIQTINSAEMAIYILTYGMFQILLLCIAVVLAAMGINKLNTKRKVK